MRVSKQHLERLLDEQTKICHQLAYDIKCKILQITKIISSFYVCGNTQMTVTICIPHVSHSKMW